MEINHTLAGVIAAEVLLAVARAMQIPADSADQRRLARLGENLPMLLSAPDQPPPVDAHGDARGRK